MPPKIGDFKPAIYTRSTGLIKARFAKLKQIVDELSNVDIPLSDIQVKKLNSYLTEIKRKHLDFENNVNRALSLEDDEISEEVLSSDQDEVQELFSHIQATIETLLPNDTPDNGSTSNDSNVSVDSTRVVSQVRLPKIDLQHFSGDPLTWTSFINLFDTTIHNNNALSNVMKFQYLLSVLSSEPLNLVKGLNLTAPNYLIAYDLLRERYHNSRRLQSLHLTQLLDLPELSSNSINGLRQFVNSYTEHTQALKALNCDVSDHNPLLSVILLRKMDSDLRKKLESHRAHSNSDASKHTMPEVADIIKFLNLECTQSEDANLHSTPSQAKKYSSSYSHSHPKVTMPKKNTFRSDVTMVTAQSSNALSPQSPQVKTTPVPTQCFLCNSNGHKIYSCDTFKNKSPHERHQLIKQYHRCISCLGNHTLKDCQSKATCRTCNQRHHTMLHFDNSQSIHAKHSAHSHNDKNYHTSAEVPATQKHPNTSVTLTSQGHHRLSTRQSTVLLGTFLIKLTSSLGTSYVFRALLDSGSMCDLITEHAAQLLGTRRYKSDVQLTGLSQNTTQNKGQTYLNIETLSGKLIASQHPMLILDNLTVELPRVPVSPEVLNLTRNYCLADPSFHLPGRIDVVIGAALYPQLFTNKQISLGQCMPHLVQTLFGYVVMGSAPCATLTAPLSNSTQVSSHLVSLHAISDSDLHSSLQRFWTQEEFPAFERKTAEEELCDNHFTTTHSRDSKGRYIVRLPFKETHPTLGASQSIAERRFHALERKFVTQPQFSQLYHNFMEEYATLDHMVKCQDLDLTSPHYFLPHHGVLKENSSTTKLRTVFDASAKTSTGVSLNDILLTGPKLQTNICDILSHFRSHNIVFSCDIRQMYRQIQIHSDDRHFQLILWRNNTTEPLSTYQLNTVTYGMNSSPYLAIKTLHQLASDEGNSFPAAAQVLRTQTYVDDIITGADTEEQAVELRDQLVTLLRRGGFELRKWISNSTRLLQSLPQEHLESPVFLQESEQPHFSILGLHWSPTSDCFTYRLNFPVDTRPTKRSVLSLVAKIYDPCGFLAPCIMSAKCFMQFLWTTGLTWDEPLPPDLSNKWNSFILDAQDLAKVSIPRSFQFSRSCAIEIHGFSDASESGYAAVTYFRCQLSNNDVVIRQIMAKTRVAPLKRVTLPRLELCAAHLLAQLVAHCLTLFNSIVSSQHIHLWCDSSVALTWLRTAPYRLKTYVANRVSQTQELVPINAWRHIASADNPADCASRGIPASQLVNHPLWWSGPSWLKLSHNDWPSTTFVPLDLSSLEETKATPLVVLATAPKIGHDLLSSYSSWDKCQRIVALILRFIHNCRGYEPLSGHLSLSEIIKARLRIFKLVQLSAFPHEIASILNQRECSKGIQRLKPFLDSDGILRVGGRLSLSALPRDSRHPVVLPKKHPIVDILIDHYHTVHLHAGPQLTQALLAQSVWILSARSVVRSRIFKCVTCFRHKPHNKTPLMGDLPPTRITPAQPFRSTGIDYCGPFTAKAVNLRSVKHVKMYLCVFVCMVTKAVHLEVVTDLTTDGFIAALTRFVSRRGLCADIYCDCGTNFVGADATLKRITDLQIHSPNSKETIHRFAIQRGIKFHFNPPAAPHQGGLWEAAVKSAKHHLRRVMGDTVLTLSQFMTLTTQVEAMLNSRPLTPLSSDPSDLNALTPGHFLIGAPLAAVPEPMVCELPTNRLKHWQLVQSFHQKIWQ